MKASIRLTEAIKKLNDKIDNIKQPSNGKDGINGKDGKDGRDGVGIKKIEINDKGHLIITLTSGKKIDLGIVKGQDGTNGAKGRNALINGLNTIEIRAGDNIIIDQAEDILTINSTGGGSDEIQISKTMPTDNNIKLWYEIDSDIDLDNLGLGSNLRGDING